MNPPTAEEQRAADIQARVDRRVKSMLGEAQVTIAVMEARVEISEQMCLELSQENARLKHQVEDMAARLEE